ncbi:type II secretion system F family protein [Microbispora cellulosiformans]|uniref:Type II secretion system F family protein n=1 Tax=Microbispora cellulosiformans TaxID=2614688 RepID=A0A5J5K0Y6_9ACTN|nr:type II secretion system F family protein [Microbispora cellulosiformans]KAA9376573.1 type II secretion system F family protein [Microbispora cellulosiformans]
MTSPRTGGEAGAAGRPAVRESPSRRGAAVALPVGFALFLLVGGVAGLVAGAAAASVVFVAVRRREPAEVRRRRARMEVDLPFAVELMVACLRAGQPMSGAVETTAAAMPGPVGERLTLVGAQMRLGAAPEDAWAALSAEPSLAALSRAMVRAARSGAPVADVLTRLADDARRTARATASAAARRVGVHAVAPLGLCFLPAFVFLGVIPMVAGLAGQILLP